MKTITLSPEFTLTIRPMNMFDKLRAVLFRNGKPIGGHTFHAGTSEKSIINHYKNKINDRKDN